MTMGTYEDIRSARSLVLAGVWVSLCLALAGLAAFVTNIEWAAGNMLAALAWVTVLSAPAAWAWLSLDRRPSLLPAAAMSSLVVAVVGLFVLVPPVHLVPALLFWLGHRRRAQVPDRVSPWKRPLMAAALVLPAVAMGSHLDPVCTTVAEDGTALTTADPSAPTGWDIGLGGATTETSTIETSASGAGESGAGTTRTCTSDTTVWWEGAAGLVVAVAVAVPGFRWPINVAAPRSDTLGV
jgi:hypothetical protein